MQGRLSSALPGRPQAFPVGTWQQEFVIARQCGFQAIEVIYDSISFGQHPLMTDIGRRQLLALARANGLTLVAICAHYLVERSSLSRAPDREGSTMLEGLIQECGAARIQRITLPLLELAHLKSVVRQQRAIAWLRQALPMAEEAGVQLLIECDIPAAEQVRLMELIGHPSVRICYDLGNATANGYNLSEDLETLAPWLAHVHVKDRRRADGASVPLGYGETNFKDAFLMLKRLGYDGALVLETPRGADPIASACSNLSFVHSCLTDGVSST